MDVLRFGLGMRFMMPEGGAAARPADGFPFTELFSALCAKDLRGLRLYGGRCRLDDGDSDNIYTIVLMNGGVKRMRSLFLKADAAFASLLTSYRPYIQTNVLRRVEGLTYYGEFDDSGALHGGDEPLGTALSEVKRVSDNVKRTRRARTAGPRLLLAPDKFKGSMSAERAAELFAAAAKRIIPNCTVRMAPIADGGEGTVDALVRAFNGTFRSAEVTAPNGGKVRARYGVLGGDTAVLEMASASGLTLVPEGERDPMKAGSRGTGELIVRALNEGMKHILLGIGGSATNDGGMGAAIALGARFYDENGTELAGSGADMLAAVRMDASGLHPALSKCGITVMCDVDTPMTDDVLTGRAGATHTFGRQKGADDAMQNLLETGMKRLEKLYDGYAGRNICREPGGGAAGGMGAMLAALAGAKLTSGAEAVLDAVRFDELLADADLVITGEGRLDAASADAGKAVGMVVGRAAARKVPSIVVAGSLGDGYKKIYDIANVGLFTCVDAPMDGREAMERAEELFAAASERACRMIALDAGRVRR